MQVNYQFNDEDRSELEIFQQSRQMYLALTEIEDYLRTKTRYNETDPMKLSRLTLKLESECMK